jgi:hypothetical protein
MLYLPNECNGGFHEEEESVHLLHLLEGMDGTSILNIILERLEGCCLCLLQNVLLCFSLCPPNWVSGPVDRRSKSVNGFAGVRMLKTVGMEEEKSASAC